MEGEGDFLCRFNISFFDTYIGYFLQALPIAVMAAFIWYVIRWRKDKETPVPQKLWSCVFVCYITGLICLVIALDAVNVIWYTLIYHMDSGHSIRLFTWDFNLIPDFFTHMNSEAVGNILMFLPFGILYPLSHPGAAFTKTLIAGFTYVAVIETAQPVFGRAFDVNDIILNIFGILISSALFFAVNMIHGRKVS